jgi:hypothetical protein
MKIQLIEDVPYNDRFNKDIAYIYCADIWWDGAGADASIFWEDTNGECHYLAIETGETTEIVKPSRKMFWDLSQQLLRVGVLEIESPTTISAIRPKDLFFSMKLKTGDATTYIVRGGMSKDEKINKVEEVLGKFVRSLGKYK